MYDPANSVSLDRELRELKRRIRLLETRNSLQRGSAHDGTTTRVQVGEIEHPYSNPPDQTDFGIIVRDGDGTPVFMVDSGGALIPALMATIQNGDVTGYMAHGHNSGSWTDADWNLYFLGLTATVLTVDLSIQCEGGVSAAQARLVTNGVNSGDNTSDPITLTCNGSYVAYRWHWDIGGDINPNDIWAATIETRVTGGAGFIYVYQPRLAALRSAVAVDTNVTG